MFLLAGGSIRNTTVVAIDIHDLGSGTWCALFNSFVEIGSNGCLACLTLHLHPIHATSKSRKARLISAPNVILAMADVHSTCRIPCWTHVRIRVTRIPGRWLT